MFVVIVVVYVSVCCLGRMVTVGLFCVDLVCMLGLIAFLGGCW